MSDNDKMQKLLSARKIRMKDGRNGLIQHANDRYVVLYFPSEGDTEQYLLCAISMDKPTLTLFPPLTVAEMKSVADLAARKLEIDGAEIRHDKALVEAEKRRVAAVEWEKEEEWKKGDAYFDHLGQLKKDGDMNGGV